MNTLYKVATLVFKGSASDGSPLRQVWKNKKKEKIGNTPTQLGKYPGKCDH